MRHSSTMSAISALCVLVALGLTSACGPSLPFLPSGPDAAARKGYEQWVKNTVIAERNAKFEVLSTTERFATVKITAEFQNAPDAPWLENEATVQVLKQANEWQPPTYFNFLPTSRAVKTQEAVRNVTATVETARQQATRSAQAVEATQQANARKTVVAQRTTEVNKPMSLQSVEDDSSAFREYFRNIEFVVVGVERASENSVLWIFAIWNHNTQDALQLSQYRDIYIVSSDGKKYDALRWDGVRVLAGERKEWVIGFNAPGVAGATYKLFMSTRAQAEQGRFYPYINWQPFEVTLR